METPSSTRRITRSQALAAQNSNTNNIPLSRKAEDSEKAVTKSRPRNGKQQQDRSALIDITNDSPIVGLAMGSLETPSSAIVKQRSCRAKNTPGSGEALLRGQVKTLLQQVEEEAELSKITLESRPLCLLQGIIANSPMGLLAPTPANTPQVSDLSVYASGSNLEKPSPLVQEQLISQVVCDIFEGRNQESLESQKSILSRSLLLDFSDKSEISSVSSECSSVITESREKSSPDDDSASIWSIQVNASSTRDEDEEEMAEEEEEEEEEEDYYLSKCDEIEEAEQDGGYDLDELCDGISNIYVDEKKKIPKFEGKHTRFVYDSDDEIVEEDLEEGEEVDSSSAQSPESAALFSPSTVRLKGLPTPRGKHLRFAEEEN